jgi:RIO kinase 1
LKYLAEYSADQSADFEETVERFSKRKDRRKPKGRRPIHELLDEDASSYAKFSDPGLQTLFERGLVTDLVAQLRSGKEATVYLAASPKGLLVAKLYADLRARSFRNDRIYREGRYISSARIQKAIDQRSEMGLAAQQLLWIEEEYGQLHTFYRAGLPVPEPIAQAGSVILMGYIGDEDGPAPRLADIKLSAEEAERALRQSVDHLAAMLGLGRVHGDYSTFNLLWWNAQVFVIDFPQVVVVKENPSAMMLLERDVRSLLKSFRAHGIRAEPLDVLSEVREKAGL